MQNNMSKHFDELYSEFYKQVMNDKNELFDISCCIINNDFKRANTKLKKFISKDNKLLEKMKELQRVLESEYCLDGKTMVKK
jgi:hypothetical protein